MMLKKLCIICLFLVAAMSAVAPGTRASEKDAPDIAESPELNRAAGQGLAFFLGLLPEAGSDQYGFPPEDRLEEARLGSGFKLLVVKPATLATYRAGDPVSSLLSETAMVYFPVVVGEATRALLLMGRQGGEWRAVGLGQPRLARAWGGLRGQWPEAKGYHPQLAVILQTGQCFFTIPELGRPNLTPLLTPEEKGGDGAKGQDYGVTGDPLETLAAVKHGLVMETGGEE